ncbi:MAG: hypothetical protein NTX11_01095 [Candidatus Saccharibacteria bacterium]|nr:hypothetical protein [Candidatus Saccharibacteria bacterium]
MNIKHKVIAFSAAFFLVAQILVTPTTAFAAKKESDFAKDAKTYTMLNAFRLCVDKYLTTDGIDKEDGPFNLDFFPGGNSIGAADVAVGHHVDGADGRYDCASDSGNRENTWFKLLGYSGYSDYKASKNGNLKDIPNDDNDQLYFVTNADATKALEGGAAKNKVFDQIDKKITELLKDYTDEEKNALQTYIYYRAFTLGCGAKVVDKNDPGDKVELNGKTYYVKDDAGEVAIGHGKYAAGGSGVANCKQIGEKIGKGQDNYNKVLGAAAGTNAVPSAGVDGTGGGGDQNATCETTFSNPLSWVMCPIFNGVADFCDFMFRNLVEPLLRVQPVETSPNAGIFRVWDSFRLYGNIILVISMLLIVFGQAIGGGLIDAYTAKKMMPRILVAAILVNLSIYIVALMVDVTNILGGGLGTLMIAPFKEASLFQFSLDGGSSAIIAGGGAIGAIGAFVSGVSFVAGAGSAAAAIGTAAPAIALFVLLPAVLGLLAAFITLVVRQGLILFLILVSPVAFALYCLPNTDKYFKKWWELLFTTLMVYPIIIVIFAVADIMTVTLQKANGFSDTTPALYQAVPSALAGIIVFVAQFLPLVLIPYAFKLAGGAIGNLHGQLTGLGKRGLEAYKGNPNDMNSRRNRLKRDVDTDREYGKYKIGRALRGRAAAADTRVAAGVGGRRRGRLAAGLYNTSSKMVSGASNEARVSAHQAAESERLQKQKATGPDNSMRDAWAEFDEETGTWWNPIRASGLYEQDADGLYYDKSDLTWNSAKNKFEANKGAVGRYTGNTTDGYTDAAGNAVARSSMGINSSAVVSKSAVDVARANAMSNPGAFQENLNYEMEKAAENNDLGKLRSRYARLTSDMGMSADEASGIWKVVGYRQQGTHLVEKYSGYQDVINPKTGKIQRVDKAADMNSLSKQFGGKSKGYEQTGQSDRTWGAIRDDIIGLSTKHEASLKPGGGPGLNGEEKKRLQYYNAGISALERGGSSLPTPGAGVSPNPNAQAGAQQQQYAPVFAVGAAGTAESVANQAYEAIKDLRERSSASFVNDLPEGAGDSGSSTY